MNFATSVRMPKCHVGNAVYDPFVKRDKAGCVFYVKDFATFIQLIGKYKFLASQDGKCDKRVFFRGQPELYGTVFSPSAYRHVKTTKIGALNNKIDALVEKLQNSLTDLKKLPLSVVEGVFQQYGLRSRWIDAVDNIWIALWFACHRCWTTENGDLHYERRDFRREKKSLQYAYILVLEVDLQGAVKPGNGGYYRNAGFECVDLRRALPSYYIRPHMQHGVLLRQMSGHGKVMVNEAGLIKGVIKIDLQDALKWLGQGDSLSVGSLFPPPHFDTGLKKLLDGEWALFGSERNHDNTPVRYSRVWA